MSRPLNRIEELILRNENAYNKTLSNIKKNSEEIKQRARAKAALRDSGLSVVGDNLYYCDDDDKFYSLVNGKFVIVNMPSCKR